jgi:hypothetical protein
MNRKVLDFISTKYVCQKMAIENDLERMVNTPPSDLSTEALSNVVMDKVEELRRITSSYQMWEGIVAQLMTPEGENNNK